MTKRFNVDKNQVLIFLFAIVVGVVISVPHWYGIYKLGKNYTPFKTTDKLQYMRDETYVYAAQARQILNGYFRGDAYTWEYRSNPSPFVSEVASVIPISILAIISGSVESALVLSDFIFPVALFLMIVWGLKKFKVGNSLAILSATATILIPNLSSLVPYVAKGGVLLTGTTNDPLLFSRTPHPQISAIFLFLSLFLTAQVIANPKKQLMVYIWAVALGISIYSSLFVASTIYLGLIILSPILLKKLDSKLVLKSLLIIFAIAFPYIINTIQFQNFIKGSDFFQRITYDKAILFPRQIRYILIALLLLRFYKKSLALIVLAFAISAGLLMDGHQLLLGRSIDADHWITRVIAPVATMALVLIIGKFLLQIFNSYSRYLLVTITILIITFGFLIQLNWINSHESDLLARPYMLEVAKEVQPKTKETDVIGSLSVEVNFFLTAIAGRRVYIAPADRSLASTTEQLQRICDLTKQSTSLTYDKMIRILEYAEGNKDWQNANEEKLLNNIKNCQKNKTEQRYKLDYFVEYQSGQFSIIKINNNLN